MSKPVRSFSTTFERGTADAQRQPPVLVLNSAWGSSQMFGTSGTDREGRGYSRLAVELLQVLYREYPNPITLNESGRSIVDTVQFKQIWNWLFDQHIICGDPANGALTVSGMRAFHSAIRQHPEINGPGQCHKQTGRASNVMIAMLRAHVFNKFSRSELT